MHATRFHFLVLSTIAAWLIPITLSPAAPLCTTHFFDWYVLNSKAAVEQRQKRWTYRGD